jgi:hypothetical protein
MFQLDMSTCAVFFTGLVHMLRWLLMQASKLRQVIAKALLLTHQQTQPAITKVHGDLLVAAAHNSHDACTLLAPARALDPPHSTVVRRYPPLHVSGA